MLGGDKVDCIESFIPNENNFIIHFEKSECCELFYGKCPVLEQQDNIMVGNTIDESCKCARLIYHIIHDGFIERNMESWIVIFKEEDGRYSISNGRHRICAASKLQIPIKFHICVEDEVK